MANVLRRPGIRPILVAFVLCAMLVSSLRSRLYSQLCINLTLVRVLPSVSHLQPLHPDELLHKRERGPDARLVAAETELQRLVLWNPQPRLYRILGVLFLMADQPQQAEVALRRADQEPLTSQLQAFVYGQRGQLDLMQSMVRRIPGAAGQFVNLGWDAWDRKDFQAALTWFEMAEALDGSIRADKAATYWALSQLYNRVGHDRPQAIYWAQRRVQVTPQSLNAYLDLAGLYIWEGQHEEAYQVMRLAEALGGDKNWIFHNQMGVIYWSRGEWDRAIERYYEAVRLNPDNPDAAWYLGEALFLRKRYQEARSALQFVLKAHTDRPDLQQRAREMLQKIDQSIP